MQRSCRGTCQKCSGLRGCNRAARARRLRGEVLRAGFSAIGEHSGEVAEVVGEGGGVVGDVVVAVWGAVRRPRHLSCLIQVPVDGSRAREWKRWVPWVVLVSWPV
jgi:hypothetical protein